MLREVVDNGLVLATVPKRQLVRVAPRSHAEQLIPKADAKDGLHVRLRRRDEPAEAVNEGPVNTHGQTVLKRQKRPCGCQFGAPGPTCTWLGHRVHSK